jgi:vesicle-associated membrane protein 7
VWRRYEGGDKVSQVMREVDQVKGVMSENINQAMSNLESTEALNEKTQEMKAQSNMFNKQAKTAKNQMWWKNMKVGSRHAPRPPGPQTRC